MVRVSKSGPGHSPRHHRGSEFSGQHTGQAGAELGDGGFFFPGAAVDGGLQPGDHCGLGEVLERGEVLGIGTAQGDIAVEVQGVDAVRGEQAPVDLADHVGQLAFSGCGIKALDPPGVGDGGLSHLRGPPRGWVWR